MQSLGVSSGLSKSFSNLSIDRHQDVQSPAYLINTRVTTFIRSISLISALSVCFMLGACNQSSEDQPVPVDAPPAPPPPFALKGHIDDLTLPKGIMFVGGFNVLDQAADRLGKELPNFLATPFDLRSQWLNNYVQTELMIESKLIHMGRPLRLIRFALPKGPGSVHLIGITDQDALIKSSDRFEMTQHEGRDLYVYRRYKGDKNPNYFMFLRDDMLAVTRDLTLLDQARLDFYDQLSHVSLSGVLNARFFPSELGLTKRDLALQERALNELALKGSRASVARQRDVLSSALQWAYQVAQDSRRIEVTLGLDQSRVNVDVDWKLSETSTTFKQLQLLKGGEHPLAQELSSVALLLSAHLPQPLLMSLTREWNRYVLTPALKESAQKPSISKSPTSSAQPKRRSKKKQEKRPKSLTPHLGGAPELISDYLMHISRATQSLSGDLALAAVVRSQEPSESAQKPSEKGQEGVAPASEIFLPTETSRSLRWVGLFQHTDLAKLRESLQTTLNIYQDKEVKMALGRRGIKVSLKTTQSMDPQGEIISIKSKMPRTPRVLRPLRPQLKELYDAHLWLGADRGVVGFSDSWSETLKSHAQPAPPSDPYVSDAFKAGVKAPFIFVYLNPVTLISALKRGRAGSMLLPLQMMFASAPNTEGIGLTVGSTPEGVSARLTVARSLLKSIRAGMSGVK